MNNKHPLIVTHDEGFHVDEVFAIALLAKLGFGVKNLNDLDIIRTRNEEKIASFMRQDGVYVIDVGRVYNEDELLFDHHQNDPNLKWKEHDKLEEVDYKGAPFLLSACGLVWKYLVKNKDRFSVMSSLNSKKLNLLEYYVKWVDVCDNGVSPWKYAPLFFAYNPIGKADDKREYEGFRKALVEAGNFIDNIVHCVEDYDLCLLTSMSPGVPVYEEAKAYMSEVLCQKTAELTESERVKFFKLFNDKYHDILTDHCIGFLMSGSKEEKIKHSMSSVIENVIAIIRAEVIAETEIKKALKLAREEGHKDILFFEDDNYNARQLTSQYSSDGLICATYYSAKNAWSITLINKSKEDIYTGRIQMPEQWAGLEGNELSERSGFDNMVFAHKGRFIVVMKGSKNDCLAVCKKIIELS